MSDISLIDFTVAIDHLSDAAKFTREARIEAKRGQSDKVKKFLALARKSAQDGVYELESLL